MSETPPQESPVAAAPSPLGRPQLGPETRGHRGEDVARSAGRGGLAVAFAKVFFILTGLVQQILLPRILGLGGYGALSTVQSAASIAYNPIVTMSIQGVSRAVAQSPEAEQPAAVRRTLLIHALVTLPFAFTFFALAGQIAQWFNAPHVVGALRLASGVMIFYGLYAPLIGVLNGKKRFIAQAGFDILAATLRTVIMLGAAWYFVKSFDKGVEGAIGGFVVSTAIVFLACLSMVGVGKAGTGGPSTAQHLKFLGPLFLGQVLLNLLLQADSLLLRKFSADAALAIHQPVQAADPLVGAYRATQLFCFLPYQILIAITFVLFPMLATAFRDGDRAAVARYVETGVRLALVIAGAMISVTSGLSGSLLRLVFPAEVAQLATGSMQLLTLGFGFFAVLGIFNAVLTSLKRERAAAFVIALAVFLVSALCYLRVRGATFGPELLWRTAMATSAGLVLATLGAAVLVKRTAGAVVAPRTVLRVVAALGVAVTIGRHLPESGKLMTLVWCAVVAAAYLATLILTRELTLADGQLVARVLGRKRS